MLPRVEPGPNIGVLLFCPEIGFLRARTSSDNARIRHFFGDEGHDWARINSFKLGIEQRLEVERGDIRTLDALETFITRRANLIQISPPRPMKVTEPEKDLDQLFNDLVGGQARTDRGSSLKGTPPANDTEVVSGQARTDRGPSLKGLLRQKFTTAGLDNKIQTDIRVTVPISESQIKVPYGFRNGRFNLIQPVRFQATNPGHAKITACRYAVEGESLYENPDPDLGPLQLILVGKFGSRQTSSRSGVERILKQHHVRLYAATEVDRLVEEIKRTAKDLPGPVPS